MGFSLWNLASRIWSKSFPLDFFLKHHNFLLELIEIFIEEKKNIFQGNMNSSEVAVINKW